jgi:hypothetical protein
VPDLWEDILLDDRDTTPKARVLPSSIVARPPDEERLLRSEVPARVEGDRPRDSEPLMTVDDLMGSVVGIGPTRKQAY